jgi:predicted membrane protein
MSVAIIQIIGVLYFIVAIRFKVWQTSLNTFLVFATVFIIVVSREIDILCYIWADYHLSIVAILLTFMMARVVIQGAKRKQVQKDKCNGCWKY